MSTQVRLIQQERYLPHTNSDAQLHKALAPLKRYCRESSGIGFTVEPFDSVDRCRLAFVLIGQSKTGVEKDSERLLQWMEMNLAGQSLHVEQYWL